VAFIGRLLPRELRLFSIIWSGQLLSVIGSSLTEFALGVWVFQRDGSAGEYALIVFFSMLPHIILSPLAGTFIDRWDRRLVVAISDAGSGMTTAGIACLLWTGRLEVWNVYVGVFAISSFVALQTPAYSALMSQLVPKHQLGRANGMNEFALASGQLVGPLAASTLMVVIGIYGVMLIDAVTFGIAVAATLAVAVPRLRSRLTPVTGETPSFARELAFGWRYIATRPALLRLVAFFFLINFSMGTFSALFTPLVLSSGSAEVLAWLLCVGSLGLLAGGMLMTVWGGPRRRVHGVLGLAPVFGLSLVLIGAQPWPLVTGAVVFVFFLTHPIIDGSDHALWQSKVPLEVQGRVFAIRRALENTSALLAYLAVGPLADRIFEPMLLTGGPLASSVGQVIGIGPGRGTGLLFVLVGTLPVAAAVLGYASRRLRTIDLSLPDTHDETLELVAITHEARDLVASGQAGP